MFAVWDIETAGLAEELVVGEILYNGQKLVFRNWHTFFFMLKELPDKTTLYAHNAGKYDNRYVFDNASKYGYKIKNKVVINGHILFTLYLSKNKKIYFRDSILLLKSGLKNLCNDFDIEHVKKDFNMLKWINAGCPETPELLEYLHYDCLSLTEIMDLFISEIGTPKMTIAGTAFSILLKTPFRDGTIGDYTKNYLKISQEEKIRQGYYGGRVEVFTRSCNHAYKYDVNSLYPAVMHDNYYPVGRVSHTTDTDKIKARIERYKHLGICKVKVKAPDNLDIPLLPMKLEGRLLFPLGEWTGWYTSIEILQALDLGYKIEYMEGFTWKRKARLFKPFVSKYYEIKKNSTGSKKLMAKYLLNSSYGKFGQRREHKEVLSMDEVIERGLDIGEFEYINDELLTHEVTSYRNRSINPVYAIFVTAYARKVLYDGMQTVKLHGGQVYYVDTDCIVSDIELPGYMVDNDALGLWKLEETIKEGVFVAPKLYKTVSIEGEHHIKAKGITRKMQQEIDTQDIQVYTGVPRYPHIFVKAKTLKKFKKLLNGGGFDFRTRNEKVTGFFEHYKRVGTDKNKSIGIIKVKKSITGKYNKRELINQIDTKPLCIYT